MLLLVVVNLLPAVILLFEVMSWQQFQTPPSDPTSSYNPGHYYQYAQPQPGLMRNNSPDVADYRRVESGPVDLYV